MKTKRKSIAVLAVVLAAVMVLGVFALTACGGGGDVTVTFKESEVTVQAGKSTTLVATASDGSPITSWSSDNEEVATVNKSGRVTGVAKGTAHITAATAGGASATCTVTVTDPVTFTFKVNGETVQTVQVDREGSPVQVTATASDGSEITTWSVEDPLIATVENGLVTGLKAGSTTINVRSSSGTGSIGLTVTDSAHPEEFVEGSNADPGKWWYYASTNDNREPNIITKELRKGVVTFEFGGNFIWNTSDLQIGLKKDATAKTGWATLNAIINSTAAGTLTVFDTVVPITTGDNNITVHYNQMDNAEMVFIQPHSDLSPTTIGVTSVTLTIKVADLKWEDWAVQDITAPTGAIQGNTVTITDTNDAATVKEYQVGLFQSDVLKGTQSSAEKTIEIDPIAFENGTYSVKVRTMGQPGYNNSAWVNVTDNYVVNNTDIAYDLERTTTPSPRWTYYNVKEDSAADPTKARFENNTVYYESAYIGWKFDSMQFFRNYGQFEAGDDLKLVMRIKANQAGWLSVSGNLIQLEADTSKEYTFFFKQPTSGATITILFGDGNADKGNFGWADAVSIEFEVKSIGKFEVTPLATPSATYSEADKKITIDSGYTDAAKASGYQVGFFDGDLKGYAAINEDGTFDDRAIANGTYELKVRAVSATNEFSNSDWSAAIKTGYVVANAGIYYEIQFGGSQDPVNASTDQGKWYYWNDQNWAGSTVGIDSAVFSDGAVTVAYNVSAGSNTFGLQLFYRDPSLTIGTKYHLSLKVNTTVAVDVTINGNVFSLTPGDNNLNVYYTEAIEDNRYSVSMQIGVNKDNYSSNTIKLSDMQWAEWTDVALAAPTLAVDTSGVATITDSNPEGSVDHYVVNFYEGGSVKAAVTAVGGQKLDVSKVPNGTYSLKAIAVAKPGYTNSPESNAVDNFVVNNEGGVKYDLKTDVVASDCPAGTWSVWAAQAAWSQGCEVLVSEAKYDNGTITVTFTSTGGPTAYGLQIAYRDTNNTTGKTYSFDIQASSDMDIQVESGGAAVTQLKAGVLQHLSGVDADNNFYVQVNIKDNVGGTITISNVTWS